MYLASTCTAQVLKSSNGSKAAQLTITVSIAFYFKQDFLRSKCTEGHIRNDTQVLAPRASGNKEKQNN